METSKLRKFASFARTSLIEQVGTRLKTVLAEKSLARRESPKVVEEIEKKIKELGEKRVLDMVAYTWFNRFCALRYMDVNRYTRIGVLSPADGQFQPEILAEAKMGHIDEELVPEATREQVIRLLDGSDKSADPQGAAYRLMLVAVCNYYHSLMPFMFEKIADYTELLLPEDLLSGTSILAHAREALLPINCSPEHTEQSVEVIGWLYQFYISEEKDAVMARKASVPTDDIPAVTQLFTPHWIVRYLIENSLGRLWLLNHPDSQLRERMPYYIDGETEADFLKISKPEDIRVLDPACGSGHMLTYAYDLLYAIYDEQGYSPTEIPGLILQHNLVGLEICDRAAALAAFSLCMKARASDSRFFRRVAQPKVIALQNIDIDKDELEDFVETLGLSELFNPLLRKLLQQFEDAKTFGSLIQPVLSENEIQSIRSRIENQKSRIEKSNNALFVHETYIKVLRVLEQAEALTERYHIVVANPPYMGFKQMNGALRTFGDTELKECSRDLYAMFIQRNIRLRMGGGFVAMVTMDSWMYGDDHTTLRSWFYENASILTMAHLGPHAFDSIQGEVVQATAFVTAPTTQLDLKAVYARLVDYAPSSAKEAALLSGQNRFRAATRSFMNVPRKILAYQATEHTLAAFALGEPLRNIAEAFTGLQTGDNPRFIRFWHEIRNDDIRFCCSSRQQAQETGARWFPYVKGSNFRRWYGNNTCVLDWMADGAAIRQHPSSTVRNSEYYFRAGLAYNNIANNFSVRAVPEGFICDQKNSMFFSDTKENAVLALGLLNSPVMGPFLEVLSPKDFNPGSLKIVPVLPGVLRGLPIHSVVNELVEIARADWDNFETSWDFSNLPLLRPGLRGATLEATWRNWETHCSKAITRMQELETENNRLFIAAYGLDGELHPEVPEDQITLARADARKDTAAFLSYAVGSMMGRYSPDRPGLILANAGDSLREFLEKVEKPLAELAFAPDEDGIIPVLDGEWFEDDIVARTRDFLRATFGESTLTENLRFIETSLGKDLRKYFLNDFYKDHLQTYKKRPIYWLFSSPKGTFNALIYMHRHRPDTVGRVLQYLRDFRDKLAHHAEHRQMTADSASASKTEKTQAIKEVAAIKKQLKELEEYEKTLFEVAARKIDVDLDDGVKHNYLLFGSVLRKIPGLDAKED